jgi:hypothetical protein
MAVAQAQRRLGGGSLRVRDERISQKHDRKNRR